MMDEFKVKITLGNAAMETAEDVATALHEVAERLKDGETEGTIMDDNGNKVGTFRLS
jgi:hypothetical protein